MDAKRNENIVNLNIFGGKVYKERVKRFWYTASVFDLLQQWKGNFPVVDTAANVLLLVIVGVHSIPLVIKKKKNTQKLSLAHEQNGTQKPFVTTHFLVVLNPADMQPKKWHVWLFGHLALNSV